MLSDGHDARQVELKTSLTAFDAVKQRSVTGEKRRGRRPGVSAWHV